MKQIKYNIFHKPILQKKLSDSETRVKTLEKTIQEMNKECKDSKIKYSSLVHENNNLKEKLVLNI